MAAKEVNVEIKKFRDQARDQDRDRMEVEVEAKGAPNGLGWRPRYQRKTDFYRPTIPN